MILVSTHKVAPFVVPWRFVWFHLHHGQFSSPWRYCSVLKQYFERTIPLQQILVQRSSTSMKTETMIEYQSMMSKNDFFATIIWDATKISESAQKFPKKETYINNVPKERHQWFNNQLKNTSGTFSIENLFSWDVPST